MSPAGALQRMEEETTGGATARTRWRAGGLKGSRGTSHRLRSPWTACASWDADKDFLQAQTAWEGRAVHFSDVDADVRIEAGRVRLRVTAFEAQNVRLHSCGELASQKEKGGRKI